MVTKSANQLKLRAVPIRIPNRNRNRFCTSHTQCVTFVTVTKRHYFEFVSSVSALVFLSLFRKTDLVTFCSQMSQMVTNSNVTGTRLFLFLFRLKRFGMNEIRQKIPQWKLCFCLLFGIRIGTALTPNAHRLPVLSHLLRSAWYTVVLNCWVVPCSLFHAGRRTKFAPGKSLRFFVLFVELSLSISVLLCSFLWYVEWIHKENLVYEYIYIYKHIHIYIHICVYIYVYIHVYIYIYIYIYSYIYRYPPIMKGHERCSKMLRIWGKIRWKEFCPFHENTGFALTLPEKDPQNSNSEESSENRETFSGIKFSPATGVRECVALFFIKPFWGIVTVPGSFLKLEAWGGRILTLHLNYVAGYTGPLLFLFERTHNYSVDNQGLAPWRLRRLGRSKVRSASSVRVLSDGKISWARGCALLCFFDPILGKSRSRCHSLNQGTWGGRILHPSESP